MFNTSLDVLYLALALCALIFTVFLCAALYQFISGARKINRIAATAEKIVIKGEEVVSFIQDKVHRSASWFLVASEMVKHIMEMYQGKKEAKKKGK